MKSISLLVFIHAVLMGQWETINQPDMGTVSRIISGGNGLIAATNQAQVYQSIDEGNSWQLLGDTLPTQPYGVDLLFEKDNAVFFYPKHWRRSLQFSVHCRVCGLDVAGIATPIIGLDQHGGQ